jgi:hypothetical protein
LLGLFTTTSGRTAIARVTPADAAKGSFSLTTANFVWNTSTEVFDAKDMAMLPGDFNNDGQTDILLLHRVISSPYETEAYFLKGQSATISPTGTIIYDSGPNNWDFTKGIYVAADENGDHRGDLVIMYDYGNYQTKIWKYVTTPTTTNSAGITFAPTMAWDSKTGNWNQKNSQIVTGDFNADGNQDILVFYDYGGSTIKDWLFIGRGTTLTYPGATLLQTHNYWDATKSQFAGGR